MDNYQNYKLEFLVDDKCYLIKNSEQNKQVTDLNDIIKTVEEIKTSSDKFLQLIIDKNNYLLSNNGRTKKNDDEEENDDQ